MSQLNSSLPAWAAVAAHANDLSKAQLRDLAASDPKRWQNFQVEFDGWLLDLSRQRITRQSLALLFDLARAVDVTGRIAAMFRGDPINSTEQRAVLHTALRSDFAGGAQIRAEVKASREQLIAFTKAVRSGKKLGISGKKFRHVVNIGIGGSDLGPSLVCDALRHEWSGDITPHFVSNVDRTQLEDLQRSIDPAETLVIVCSKTFMTQETQANADAARAWIVGALGEKAPADHFVAVSTNGPAMDKFGIAADHRFTMWDWVGGRYSVWSAIGLIAEIVIGSKRFEEFLKGASDVDRHFTTAPFEKNLPILLGLIGVWNRTFLNLPTLAVLPYDQRLARLPAYLQQLEMESNGKSVSLDGVHVDFATAPVVWGEPGSNAQHSFFQMLHQGTLTQALDFIAPLRGSWGGIDGQNLALQNCFAQSQAFAYGHTLADVEAEMRKAGASTAEIERIGPHRVHEGNRPSSLLLFPQTTARTLGQLLALYEHSVFVQGSVWGINSFDQFGVELGKKLAAGIDMTGAKAPQGHGAAGLTALIDYVAKHR
ncbi:MAG TPA: glucose-6-phosphate isomerase [Steroidobacteraceae bacterium]|jgi:glucose-6-phosphate isomerase|nr:glucose-6-phosphate isomerase [Steroidobacteraceae bacterium]